VAASFISELPSSRKSPPLGKVTGPVREGCACALLVSTLIVRVAINLTSDLFQIFFQATAAKSARSTQSFGYRLGSISSEISDDPA